MPIEGVAYSIPKIYIGRSALKFLITRPCKKQIVFCYGRVRQLHIRDFTHLNPNNSLDTFELEAEIELLPMIDNAGKHGRIKYVIQNETLFESRYISKIHSGRGKFCDIPCKFISAPLSYSRVFSGLGSDDKEVTLTPQPFIENKRFLELQRMLSAYQGTGNPDSNQIFNVLQLWCAEQNGCDYFLTVDYSLIEVIREQNGRLLTKVVKPSELIKIIFNNENRELT